MSTNVIEAEFRTVTGKQVSQLRRAGFVPGVVYGQAEPVHIQLDDSAFRAVLRKTGTAELYDLSIGGKTVSVLIKELQRHPTRKDLLHVDFYEVRADELLTQTVELVAVGTSPAAGASGFVTLLENSVDIECLPRHLVSHIDVNMALITSPDDQITVGDLVAPEGVTILTDPELVIAKFEYVQTEEAAAEDDMDMGPAADSVEVITAADDE